MRNYMKVSLVLILIAILLIMVFRGTIFQEGNPIKIWFAILKLNISNQEMVQFTEQPTMKYVVKRNPEESNYKASSKAYDPYIKVKKNEGWHFVEQMGAGLVFEKDGTNRVAETRMYTRHYIVIEDFK